MDPPKVNQYLEKLEELVYDEDKIVTCVFLAELLAIPIQDSKVLLSKFVENQRQKKPQDLSVTYLLSGIAERDGFLTVTLVNEHDLKEKKAKFESVIGELLYSVQKTNDIDFNIIAQVEKSLPDKPRIESLIGSVVGKNCVKRTLRPRAVPAPQPAQKQIGKAKPSFFTKLEPKGGTKSDVKKEKGEESKATAETNSKIKQDTKVKGKGGISNFFTKGAAKPVGNENKTVKKEKSEKKVNGIEKDDVTESGKQNEPTPDVTEEKMEVDDLDNDDKLERPIVEKKKNSASAKKDKKKRPNKENNDQPNKKRKRIAQRDDSDSDDMFGGEEDNYDDIIERSMEEEPEPVPVQKTPLAPKNKIRIAVDKTYEDEDGYIVTRTEYIYETPSEDETEEVIKPPEKPPPKTPVNNEKKKPNSSFDDTSPSNNKGSKGKKGKKAPAANQPTLMNFFKKK